MPDFKPILFNTAMIKAILEGRKTQTRRLVKQPPIVGDILHDEKGWYYDDGTKNGHTLIPPCNPGDILWVRETWDNVPVSHGGHFRFVGRYYYKVDGDLRPDGWRGNWHPSIHMPKEAARIFLLVKDVRVERLQEITKQDAISEGISRLFDCLTKAEYEEWANRSGVQVPQNEQPWNNYLWHGHFGVHGMGNRISNAWPWQLSGYANPRGSFSSLWNRTVDLKDWDKYGWDANPWVWVIKFERVENPANWVLEVDRP